MQRIKSISYNWRATPDGGEASEWAQVGYNSVEKIEEYWEHGAGVFYEVYYEGGTMNRIHNPNVVVFETVKEGEGVVAGAAEPMEDLPF